MEKNVVLKKDFRGLKAGSEFAYDAKTDTWRFETSGEELTDTSHKTFTSKVQFSDSYVRSRPEVFEVPGQEEKEKFLKEQKIKDLEALVKNTQDEITRLKEDG